MVPAEAKHTAMDETAGAGRAPSVIWKPLLCLVT
jgi:hypothetical protein